MGDWSSLSTISGSHVDEILRPLFQAPVPTWVGDLPTLVTRNALYFPSFLANRNPHGLLGGPTPSHAWAHELGDEREDFVVGLGPAEVAVPVLDVAVEGHVRHVD